MGIMEKDNENYNNGLYGVKGFRGFFLKQIASQPQVVEEVWSVDRKGG